MKPIGPPFRKDGIHSTTNYSFNDSSCHLPWIRDNDAPEAYINYLLPLIVCMIDKVYQVRRRSPFLCAYVCVFEKPVSCANKINDVAEEAQRHCYLPLGSIRANRWEVVPR